MVTTAVQWILWVLIMTLVMWWVSRSQTRARPKADQQLLQIPSSALVLALVCALFFFGLAIISNTIGKNETTSIWTTLIFVGFGVLSLFLIAEYFFARHRVFDQGMTYGRMLGQRGVFQWSEVAHIKYAPYMRWFVIKLHSGKTVRVSSLVMGLPEFARLVLLHVPKQAMNEETRAFFEEIEERGLPLV